MKNYKLKSEVGYKLIHGMKAVGNQCQDCGHQIFTEDGKLFCEVVRAIVNERGHCSEHVCTALALHYNH